MENQQDIFSPLSNIQQVDAPPFLFTKVMAKISNSVQDKIAPGLAWSLSIAFSLLLVINVFVLSKQIANRKSENNMAKAFGVMPQNSLYP
jgi:hypothetical protein